MLLKNEVFGIKIELSENQKETCEDEARVLVAGTDVFVKRDNLGIRDNVEKFAVLGESPFFLKNSGIVDIFGPRKDRSYLAKINSRGYLQEILVPEESLLFLK